MRRKRLIPLILCLVLLLGLTPAAFAQEDGRFEGKSWDEVLAAFWKEWEIDPDRVTCGYYNTATGEEHYWRGDEYMVSGSMYKVPINMVFTERISKGEMDWDKLINGLRYDKALEFTVINSNNDVARDMWNALGGYQEYRRLICPYMGVDAETVEEKFWENNFFTSRQMIFCLKTLYEGGEERFPRLIETMRKAEPQNYFKFHEQSVDIAHKYGYYTENNGYTLYLNDCAICYTEEPICIVLFTDTIKNPYVVLTEFCKLMCDYAQYHTEQDRIEAEKAAEEAALAALEQEALPPETAAKAPAATGAEELSSPALPREEGEKLPGRRFSTVLLLVLVAAGAIAAVLAVFRRAVDGKLRLGWGLLAVIFSAGALTACILGPNMQTQYDDELQGDPQETVTRFFTALESGSYETAYACLDGCSTLGLENAPEDGAAALLYGALRESYSHKLHGEAETEGLQARQVVLFRYLDLARMKEDLQTEADTAAEKLVEELPREEVYDENDAYLSSFTDRVFETALTEVLTRAEGYYTTVAMELMLNYTDAGWQIEADDTLTAALTGSAA